MSDQTDYSIQGGCLCGAVRFELTAAPTSAGYCHCTRCQRRTGTGFSASAFIDPASLRWLQGEDLIRGWLPPEDGAEKCFCGSAARICSRAAETDRASASGWPPSTPTLACVPAVVSTSPTRPAGTRSPTTACRASTRPVRAECPDSLIRGRLRGCWHQRDLSRQPAQERRQLGVTFRLPAVEQPRQRGSSRFDQPLRRLMPDLGHRAVIRFRRSVPIWGHHAALGQLRQSGLCALQGHIPVGRQLLERRLRLAVPAHEQPGRGR